MTIANKKLHDFFIKKNFAYWEKSRVLNCPFQPFGPIFFYQFCVQQWLRNSSWIFTTSVVKSTLFCCFAMQGFWWEKIFSSTLLSWVLFDDSQSELILTNMFVSYNQLKCNPYFSRDVDVPFFTWSEGNRRRVHAGLRVAVCYCISWSLVTTLWARITLSAC